MPDLPIVQYHPGGPLWAGDTVDHPAGWYLYRGEGIDPEPVIVDFRGSDVANPSNH